MARHWVPETAVERRDARPAPPQADGPERPYEAAPVIPAARRPLPSAAERTDVAPA